MKTILLSFLTCLIITCLCLSCSTRATESREEVQNAESPEAIYLEGIYATATRLPLRDFAIDHLFDGDSTTYWSTPVGAGPDEGFVLYFPSPTHIREIELNQAAGNELATITEVSIYADGHPLGDFSPSLPVKIDKTLTSMFVKITTTDKEKVEYLTSEKQEDLSLERFDDRSSIGLSDISFFGEQGLLRVKPPLTARGSVTASSVLEPKDAYAAEQLFDSRREFVWAEGTEGSGENQQLIFNVSKEKQISSLKIWNGYQRSEKHFSSNARIKSFEFGSKAGKKFTYTLEDKIGPQMVSLDEPVKGKDFEFTILEVYPGKVYQDLAVSELLFFDGTVPFVIRDETTEEALNALASSAKGSVLESYLDKRLKNVIEYPDFSSERSLILRSNRTFVLYDHTNASDDSREIDKQVVADGNWELLEQGNGYAKVRIFGKLFNLSETLEYYKGNATKEFVTIFQDNLNITPDGIKGEKFVEAFYCKSAQSL